MVWRAVTLLLLGAVSAFTTFTAPPNVVNQEGATDTVITCGITAQATATDKAWHKTSGSGTELADNNGIVAAKQADYGMELETDNWNLKIKKALEEDDADKYVCTQDSNTGTARLILVESPSCALANKDADKVTFTCSAGYKGDWPPRATMKDNADSPIGDAVVGTGGTISREQEISVSAANNGHIFKCEIGFVISDNPDSAADNVAKNIPDTTDAKYKCSVTSVKPAGVTITSGGEHTELVEDDTLTCAASTAGVPTAAIKWTDPEDDELGTGATYALTATMVGKAVTCSVRNNIGSSSATFPAPESSGRMTRVAVGELGLAVMTAFLCVYLGTM